MAQAAAYYNWGRWLAPCPKCKVANDIQPDQTTFTCPACRPDLRAWAIKMDADGFGRPVADTAKQVAAAEQAIEAGEVYGIVWPENWREIEAALRARPVPAMNWLPGEDVADLLAENEARGLNA